MHTLTLITLLSATLPTSLAACTDFLPIATYTNINANTSASAMNSTFPPIRISNAIDCNATTPADETCPSNTCLLRTVPTLLVRVNRQLNLSVSEEFADEIFNLIRPELPDSANVNTNASWVYSAEVGGVSYCVERGTSAWFGFTPSVACVMGRLSGCMGDGIENGTVVMGCGVQVREGTADDVVPILGPGEIQITREPAGSEEGPPVNATVESVQGNSAVGILSIGEGRVLGLVCWTGILGLVTFL